MRPRRLSAVLVLSLLLAAAPLVASAQEPSPTATPEAPAPGEAVASPEASLPTVVAPEPPAAEAVATEAPAAMAPVEPSAAPAGDAPAAGTTEVAGSIPPPGDTISTRSFEEPSGTPPPTDAPTAAGSTAAAAPGAARGHFRSKDLEFELLDGYAFRSEEFLLGGKTIALAISNAAFNAEFIDQYHDRKALIDQFFVDEETAVVYLLFGADGAFRGISYQLEPGNGCGFCEDPTVQSTVKLADGRLVGTLALDSPERTFDITVDATVASDDFGVEQGANGGASGAGYLRIHNALSRRDQAALVGLLATERLAEWNEAKALGAAQGEIFFASLADAHPTSFRITRAFEKGDRALLLLVGTSPDGPVRGEALLRKEKGVWRLHDEVFRRVAGE